MADTEEDNPVDCLLHKCVFEDDYRRLSQLIRTHNVARKDKHGEHLDKYGVINKFYNNLIGSLHEFLKLFTNLNNNISIFEWCLYDIFIT